MYKCDRPDVFVIFKLANNVLRNSVLSEDMKTLLQNIYRELDPSMKDKLLNRYSDLINKIS